MVHSGSTMTEAVKVVGKNMVLYTLGWIKQTAWV